MKNLSLLIAISLLVACSENSSPPAQSTTTEASTPVISETDRLTAWLDEEFATELDFSPLSKTRLGDKSDYGELDDVSEAALDEELAWRRESVAHMREEFDYAALNDEGKLSWDLWEYQLDAAERALPFRRHRYIFGRNGPQTGLPNGLINYHNVDTVDDMEAYISRLDQSNRYMLQYLTRAKASVADGIRAPYFDYDQAISEIQRVTSGAPFSEQGDSAIWTDVTEKIDKLVEQGEATVEQAADLRERAEQALLNSFKPAYDEVLAWLEEDRVNVPDQATGASALPDGDAYYAQRLRAMTTLPMTAREVHDLGLAEVARIQEEMQGIRQAVGLDRKSVV